MSCFRFLDNYDMTFVFLSCNTPLISISSVWNINHLSFSFPPFSGTIRLLFMLIINKLELDLNSAHAQKN